MPIVCTCGTSLPDDARFCHRCGRPQWEADQGLGADSTPHAIATPPALPSGAEPRVSFSNPLALRTSLLVASVTTILEMIPFAILIAPALGGFVAVSLYQRRSGRALTPVEGAKLGWMTALLNVLLLTLFISLQVAVIGAAFFDTLRTSIRQQASSPAQQQVLQMLNDSRSLPFILLLAWIMLFTYFSLSHMAGGALGARFKRPKPS